MVKIITLVTLMGIFIGFQISCVDSRNGNDNAFYVNPFIGTANNGHTFPGAALPFGLVQAGPENGRTDWKYCSGYNYADSIIVGFAQDHLNGTGCPDLGDILLMPFSGNADQPKYTSHFAKETEKAKPGYYRVTLTDFGVDAEITATSHTAFHKYTFNKENAYILVDLQSGIAWNEKSLSNHVLVADDKVINDSTISGHHQLNVWVTRQLFYVIEFDKPFKISHVLPMNQGEKAKRYVLGFNIKPGENVQVKVALSTVSIEGAKANMVAENPGWDFEEIRRKAYNEWNTLLSVVQIEGTHDQKESFYTSLYHLYLQPNNIADVDGKYRGANDSLYFSKSKKYYSTLSLWDTYRAAHPLYTILVPKKVDDMINSMVGHYQSVGILPIWTLWGKENYCMIGNHSIPVIVDAYLKGFKGFDAGKAYEAIKISSTKSHQKSNWEVYDKYKYLPFDLIKEESVSRTLESGFDDYCVAQMAKALGKTDDYRFFSDRSKYYKNLFDPQTKFMRGRDSNGNWRKPFDLFQLSHAGTSGGDYTEGNAWQYTWHVQHDVAGLTQLMGGNGVFATKLDSLFKLEPVIKGTGFTSDVSGLIGQYAHGNEPCHHVAYLFTLIGKGWRTQELVREINDQFYLNKPDGLCGNDDCGQMSAWYIFTAMGFYPVNPVSGEYVFGAPQLKKITIALPDNKTFTIVADNLSKDNKYIQRIVLNNKQYDKPFINHQDIMNGGLLVYSMGDRPKKN